MPINDLGYRSWSGALEPPWARWWVIAETGIRLAWRSLWLRRILLLAWLPTVYFGIGVFLFENAVKQSDGRSLGAMLSPFFRMVPQFEGLMDSLDEGDLGRARHTFWSYLLWWFFRSPQGIMMIILVGLVAPNLVAQDLRSRAYLIYFSRPITAWEYVLGKSVVVWSYLAMITLVPALVLYLLGIALSPSLGVVWHTWDIPLRIVVASIILMIPTSCLALCFSSLTPESRYAGFAWFALCFGGWMAHTVLTIRDFAGTGLGSLTVATDRWAFVSLYHMLGQVQNGIFGLHADYQAVFIYGCLLGIITLISLAVLHYRITLPLRI